MPLFAYRAKKPTGEVIRGTIAAESERAAAEAISRQDAFPVEVRRRTVRAWRLPRLDVRRRHARPAEVAAFLVQLADLVRAGVPLLRSLNTLAAQGGRRPMGAVASRLAQEVARGRALWEVMSGFPVEFPRLIVSVVRAGEAGGFLEEALRRAGTFLDREVDLRARVRAALAYPVLLLAIGSIAVGFLLVFFIPRFTAIFEQLRAVELPWITRVVVGFGGFMRQHGLWVLGAAAAGALALRAAARTAPGRRLFESLWLALPWLGEAIRRRMVARFARTLGALVQNGVPLVDALAIARDALDSALYGPTIQDVIAGVRQGRPLVEGLRRVGLFPPDALDMVAVGEEAATLPEVLAGLAEAYETRAERTIRTLVALLEPLLLVVMAVIVGVVVIAMLLPVFTISSGIR